MLWLFAQPPDTTIAWHGGSIAPYSDRGKGDKALTRTRAAAACHQLVKDGFKGKVKSVGEGHADPIAANGSEKGRAENRRLVITFRI